MGADVGDRWARRPFDGLRSAPLPSLHLSGLPDPSAQLILDMRADNLVERRLGPKAQRGGAARVKILRPAGHDLGDRGVGLAADASYGIGAGNARERRDLLANRTAQTRHGEI